MAVATQEGPVAIALADPGGELILIGGDGKPRKSIGNTGGRPTALHLRLTDGGLRPATRTATCGSGTPRPAPCSSSTITKNGSAQSGSARPVAWPSRPATGCTCAPLDARASGPGLVLEGVADEAVSALFSADGNWLAAVTNNGSRHLWSLRDRAHPEPRTLPIDGRTSGVTCIAFDRDVQWLGAGEGDGGIRCWDLANRRERPRIPPHRGKVDGLSVSADGRFLLQITHDAQALIWDLKEGRGVAEPRQAAGPREHLCPNRPGWR